MSGNGSHLLCTGRSQNYTYRIAFSFHEGLEIKCVCERKSQSKESKVGRIRNGPIDFHQRLTLTQSTQKTTHSAAHTIAAFSHSTRRASVSMRACNRLVRLSFGCAALSHSARQLFLQTHLHLSFTLVHTDDRKRPSYVFSKNEGSVKGKR